MHKALLDLILTLIRKGIPLDAVVPALADLCTLADDPKTGRRARATGAKVLALVNEAIDDKAP